MTTGSGVDSAPGNTDASGTDPDYSDISIKDSSLSRPVVALYRLLGAVLAIGLWALITELEIVQPQFLPGPWEVADTLLRFGELNIGLHVRVTLLEAFDGFGLGFVAGVVLGIVLGLMRRTYEVVAPFITVMNATPRIALAPLFVIWFGIGMLSHIALVFSVSFFIILSNAVAGTQSVDREYLTLARILGARRREIVLKIVIPSVVPWIIAAMRLAWAYSIAAAVVAGMFFGQEGLGYLIASASGSLNVSIIFAALVIVIVIAWIVDNLLRLLERWLLRWRAQDARGGLVKSVA